MIKIEVIYKDTDQAPEYFEVEGFSNYEVANGCFFAATHNPFKGVIIPMESVLRIETEEVDDDV